jgi:hypothetical protein
MRKQSIINKIFGIHLAGLMTLGLFLSYIYFVNLATFNISKTERVLEEITITQSLISQLEFDFIQKNKEIVNLSPLNFGLNHTITDSDKVFVKRQINNRLTLNER